jgi:hypothetical protein
MDFDYARCPACNSCVPLNTPDDLICSCGGTRRPYDQGGYLESPEEEAARLAEEQRFAQGWLAAPKLDSDTDRYVLETRVIPYLASPEREKWAKLAAEHLERRWQQAERPEAGTVLAVAPIVSEDDYSAAVDRLAAVPRDSDVWHLLKAEIGRYKRLSVVPPRSSATVDIHTKATQHD